MMKYKEKYQKITDELIEKSFPELKGKRIWIKEYSGLSSGGAIYTPFFEILCINKKIRSFTKDQQIGLIAHELSHFSIFLRRGFFKGMLKGLLYFSSGNHRKQEETKTIKLSIKRGYGKQYHNLSKIAWRDAKRRRRNKFYLSPKEIKSYAKKIGKW